MCSISPVNRIVYNDGEIKHIRDDQNRLRPLFRGWDQWFAYLAVVVAGTWGTCRKAKAACVMARSAPTRAHTFIAP
jgi:hypothetical protein